MKVQNTDQTHHMSHLHINTPPFVDTIQHILILMETKYTHINGHYTVSFPKHRQYNNNVKFSRQPVPSSERRKLYLY